MNEYQIAEIRDVLDLEGFDAAEIDIVILTVRAALSDEILGTEEEETE